MSVPQDGALSGEEMPDPAEVAAIAQQQMMEAMAARQPQGWRPACVNCLNGHKIAVAEFVKKMQGLGMQVGDPRFSEALNAARHAGMIFAQNPMAAIGQNGTKPDMIPPIRPADTIVNGSAVCMVCFMPQKQTNLLIAPGGWTPGR
jgi:hypothetical protein